MGRPEPATFLTGIRFAEGARWRDGRLWFSEMATRRVHAVSMDGVDDVVCELADGVPSGLGWLPDGRLLVASMDPRVIVRLEPDGALVVHADLGDLAVALLNDMVVDRRGRAYVGSTGCDYFRGETERRPANVIVVHPDGRVAVVADDLLGPNGPGFTADGDTYIVAESNRHRLLAFDIAADGSLVNRRVYADLDPVLPDGIAVDREGGVWAASPHTDECVRVLPDGTITHRIARPGPVICCALGGPDGHTLFLCGLQPGQPIAITSEAIIETVRVDVPA